MTTHCISAAKNAATSHDRAELVLLAPAACQAACPGAPLNLTAAGRRQDAANIAAFLCEHLPAETLSALIAELGRR